MKLISTTEINLMLGIVTAAVVLLTTTATTTIPTAMAQVIACDNEVATIVGTPGNDI
jgi:hypothetical protein